MSITGDKMLSHLDRIVGEHKPITADIFITNYCNNKCPYCTYKRWVHDNKTISTKYEDFVKYTERLITFGVRGVILTGGGEPTLNPDFLKITQWLEDRQINYGINTNFNRLLFFRPNYLKVSLDGYDEDSYEKSRGVRKYKQVIDNIKQYAEWKKENSPNTSLGIQWTAFDVEGVKKFYAANKDLNVDYIVFRPIESTGGNYYKDKKEKDKVPEIIKAIKDLRKRDKRVTLNFKWHLLARQEESCTGAWAQIAMNEKGEIIYCCHKPYEVIGHVLDNDILQKKDEAITNMNMCDIPCRMTAPKRSYYEYEYVRHSM